MMSDSLPRLQEELRVFARERDWERYHTPRNLAALISSEAGELLALFRWDQDSVAERPAEVAQELADVFLGVLRFADVRTVGKCAGWPRADAGRSQGTYPARGARKGGAGVPRRAWGIACSPTRIVKGSSKATATAVRVGVSVYARRRRRAGKVAALDSLPSMAQRQEPGESRDLREHEKYDGIGPHDLADVLDAQPSGVELPKLERSSHRELSPRRRSPVGTLR
jgi:NTP pyrophosphatase (non-canonical NTP hydrolase)